MTVENPELRRRIREKIKYIRAHRKAVRDNAYETIKRFHPEMEPILLPRMKGLGMYKGANTKSTVTSSTTASTVAPIPTGQMKSKLSSPGAPSLQFYDTGGRATISPMQARTNLYRDVYGQKGRSQQDADTAATASMNAAQRARWRTLKNVGRLPANAVFDPNANYPIYPHSTVTGDTYIKPGDKVTPTSINNPIPVMSDSSTDRAGLFLNVYRTISTSSGKPDSTAFHTEPNYIAMGRMDSYNGGKFRNTFLHEGTHLFTPVATGMGDKELSTSFYGLGGDNAKNNQYGSGYANGPAEALVSIGAEKARMSANGIDTTQPNLGRLWAKQTLASRPPSFDSYIAPYKKELDSLPEMKRTSSGPGRISYSYPRYDRISQLKEEWNKKYNQNDDFNKAMNVKSLQGILFHLQDAASKPDATPADKKALEDFLDSLDYYFPLARNSGTNEGVKTAEMNRDRIQAQYARHPQSSLDVLARRLAKNKWGVRDIVREDGAHREEFGITGEDKEYLDRYIIARIAEQYDRRAKCKQAIMRKLWEKGHNGESFDAALPARMARFRQYEGTPFGNYSNPIEQRKYDSQPASMPDGAWDNYLKTT